MNLSRLAVWGLLLAGAGLGMAQAPAAQTFRGTAVQIAGRAEPVELLRFRFLTFAFGHEGPMDTPLSTRPVNGRQYLVEADVSGIESAATIRFELVDTANRPLQTPAFWKTSDGADDGEFYGFVTVPGQPFRIAISGTTIGGVPFRAILAPLVQPSASAPVEQPVLPPGLDAAQRTQLEQMVSAYRQELQARGARAAIDHPDGVIALPRVEVSPIAYEPLAGASGAAIGLRLRYSMRFPAARTIVAVPLVFPVYQQPAWRGLVEMKPLAGTITPPPQMVGVQSLQDVIVYRAGATYQAGITYSFAVDLVPDYVFQGTLTGRFCLYEQKFSNRTVWDAIKASQTPVPYTISISDTDTSARIPLGHPQQTFYQSFLAIGALDCGPGANIRF